MANVRPPAVAGQFYPADAQQLRAEVRTYLAEAVAPGPPTAAIKALIVPHAGYIYSGPVAASAYALLKPRRESVARVVLLGPAHRVYLEGLAVPSVDYFRTPLGDLDIDQAGAQRIKDLTQVQVMDEAHRLEHSLEVQLPFLQTVLARFALLPLVVGESTSGEVAEVLESLWGGSETVVVVSSDLSHYHDYASARRLDSETSRAIVERRSTLTPEQACGCRPLNGLLQLARRLDLRVTALDLRNSGDTAGPAHQVVGYGAYALH
ncbi:MAG: AmmeMemoRadiSam system protein B [Gammaproteobacteria bacterium]